MVVSVSFLLLAAVGVVAGLVVVPEKELGTEGSCLRNATEKECGGTDPSEWKMAWCRGLETAKRLISKKPTAQEILKGMDDDGAFSDLRPKYSMKKDNSRALMDHGRRLATLLLHYQDNKTEELLKKIEKGFDYIARRVKLNEDDNRWGHLMGTPRDMFPSAMLAKCVIDDTLLKDYLDRYWAEAKYGPVWNLSDHGGYMAGGNLATRSLVGEVEGMVRGGQFMIDRHTSVDAELKRDLAEMKSWRGDGLRPDGCLHQHNLVEKDGYLDRTLYLIYNGSYGMEMLLQLSRLFKWFRDLDLQYGQPTMDKLFVAFLDCHRWLFRGKTFEPTSCGRFIDQGQKVTREATKSGVNEVAENLLSLGQHTQELEDVRCRYEHPRPDQCSALEVHKHFYNSDLTVHHRLGYMASVRVLSNRTCRPETWPGKNYYGFFQADGWLTVLVDGSEYGNGSIGTEIFKVYDWALVPGVTNVHTCQVPEMRKAEVRAKQFFNNAQFVGGVTDDKVGLTTMYYNRTQASVSVTAFKSYFFFDDVIVVVGSRISRDPDDYIGRHVVTTLAQVEFDTANGATLGSSDGGEETVALGDVLSFKKQPKYLHHRKVGYVFLKGNEVVHVKAEKHEEKYNIFTAVLDHDKVPYKAKLAYAVYPDKTLEETKTYAANPRVEVLVNEPHRHVVCHEDTETVAVAIRLGKHLSVGSCGTVSTFVLTVSDPLLALFKFSDSKVDVWVADPTQNLERVIFNLTINGNSFREVVQLPGDNVKSKSKLTTINLS